MSSITDMIDVYQCPHCQADLVLGSTGWSGWARCPVCKLPSLPPEPETTRDFPGRRNGARALERPFPIEDSVDASAWNTASVGASAEKRLSRSNPARLIFRTGLVASIALAFVAFLDHRTTQALIFGGLAIVFLLLLSGAGSRLAGRTFKANESHHSTRGPSEPI